MQYQERPETGLKVSYKGNKEFEGIWGTNSARSTMCTTSAPDHCILIGLKAETQATGGRKLVSDTYTFYLSPSSETHVPQNVIFTYQFDPEEHQVK